MAIQVLAELVIAGRTLLVWAEQPFTGEEADILPVATLSVTPVATQIIIELEVVLAIILLAQAAAAAAVATQWGLVKSLAMVELHTTSDLLSA